MFFNFVFNLSFRLIWLLLRLSTKFKAWYNWWFLLYLFQIVFQDLKPQKWPCIPKDIHDIIIGCCMTNPEDRIDICRIGKLLNSILISLNGGNIHQHFGKLFLSNVIKIPFDRYKTIALQVILLGQYGITQITFCINYKC